MATANSAQRQNINTQLILIGFAVMTVAFAFVAILTNMIVNSKVNALRSYQSNPVTVSAAPQSNTVAATSCVAPATTAAVTSPVVAGQTNMLPGFGSGVASASWLVPLGNYSQSNSSTINTTSNNTFIKDSYNTTTVNTDNSDNSTNNQNVGNTTDSGNTTVTTVATTTNTDNSVNTTDSNNTSTVTNTNNQNIGNTTNSNNPILSNNNVAVDSGNTIDTSGSIGSPVTL